MSRENVLSFIYQVTLNPALQARVQTAPDFPALQAIASTEGYTFTEEQWNIASAEAFNGLLTDEDLNEVNAGLTPPPSQNIAVSGLGGSFGGFGKQQAGQGLVKFVPKLT